LRPLIKFLIARKAIIKSIPHDMAHINSATFSKKVREMLGLDLDSWNNMLVASLAIAAAAAVIVGVSTFAVIRLQNAAELETKEEFDRYKLEAAKSISEANARTKEAEVKLAEIREKLGRPRQLARIMHQG
jgi:hypothetical protein